MARYRRMSMAIRPVQRIKHVVDLTGTVAAATNLNQTVVIATDTPTLAGTTGVITGSKINGIYLRLEVASNEAIDLGAIPNVYMAIWKNPGGNLVISDPSTIGDDDNKRFVIHQEMTMIENKGQGSNPRTVFNGVVVIPKGYRRFGPNDTLVVSIRSPALDIATCLQCHYKEFR